MTKPQAAPEKQRAPRNRTLTIETSERTPLASQLNVLTEAVSVEDITNQLVNQDIFTALAHLPSNFIDLLVVDPPYNLTKNFNGRTFAKSSSNDYEEWLDGWLSQIRRLLKHTASLYVCCDWQSSASIQKVLSKYFTIRNRITWEREKGRGALSNWKNCSEDIWYCTVSDDFYFDVEAVKMKRKVIAPYRDTTGKPKDWDETDQGNFRLTHPSNLWTDISIPFWSMPENTDHPTQKPEKLIAKLILASSRPGDFVFDPFFGSGTTCVVSKKLQRKFAGVEIDEEYCCMAVKRLIQADSDASIQGYHDGYFWERNSLVDQKASTPDNIELRKGRGRPKRIEESNDLQMHQGAGLFDE